MLISYLYYYSQNKSVYFRKNNYLNTIDRVSNRQTTWYLINIKARRKQTTEHYVQVFRSLYEQDPLVGFPRGGKLGSLKYVTFSNLLDENGNCRRDISIVPAMVALILTGYTYADLLLAINLLQ